MSSIIALDLVIFDVFDHCKLSQAQAWISIQPQAQGAVPAPSLDVKGVEVVSSSGFQDRTKMKQAFPGVGAGTAP
jgi:hypothetical protein